VPDLNNPETVDQIVQMIRRDLPDAPQGMSQGEFDKLCGNIARAIIVTLQQHEQRQHRIEPEFGEPQRPGD
jgi:hypothetical protein